MSELFSPYPVLDNAQYMAIGYASDLPMFSYTENAEEFLLQLDISGGTSSSHVGKISDPRCSWYPATHDLILNKTCRIASGYSLFGDNGIASESAVIGVALRWISSESDERGVIPFGQIGSADSAVEFEIHHLFERGTLKGSLKLQTILYLQNPGTPKDQELYFAQQSGTVLGVLEQEEYYIHGNGSVFPIAVINAPGKGLWTVFYNDTADPMQDKFRSENVEIQLNKAHPNYDQLKIEASMIESPLFVEVLSSALMVIVESVKEAAGEEWENILEGTGFESGSIAEAVYYFITRLRWDVSSPSRLSASIKEFFEKSR